jgi:hypothetical protein
VLRHIRCLLLIGILSFLAVAPASAQDDLVPNPFYKFWAASKLGSTASHIEQTKLSGPDAKVLPDSVDEKRVTYKLVEMDKDQLVVVMVVTEKDLLGFVQAAPTRYIYPAKVKKSHLERVMADTGDKPGDDTLKVDGKELKVKTFTGTIKGSDGEQIEYKLWLSGEVPGGVVKKIQTTKQKGEVVAETTTTLKSFKKAE